MIINNFRVGGIIILPTLFGNVLNLLFCKNYILEHNKIKGFYFINMVELSQVCTKYPKSVQHTYLVDVCDEDMDRYRFGYNGQEKVNEIAGVGNHNTAEFWEYDTRLGRRWNRDPVVKEWESPYAGLNNNPIWKTDVKGDDAKVKINNDAGTIDISTTVHVTGGSDEDRAEFVKNANEFVKEKMDRFGKMNGSYKDENGKEWAINLHVNYVDGGKVEGRVGEGENIMDISNIYQGGRSKVNGGDFYDSKTKTMNYNTAGTGATMRGAGSIKYGFKPLHETMHFLGLSDRYEEGDYVHTGYEFDIMSERGTNIHQNHWDNWGKATLKVGNDFILKHRVDIIGDHNMKFLQPEQQATTRGTKPTKRTK